MRGPGTWWRGKSTPAKVETYTRWSFHFFAVMEVVSVALPVIGEMSSKLGGWLLLMVSAHAAVSALVVSRALDWVCGRREQPVRLMWALGAVTAAVAATGLAVVEYGPKGDGVDSAAGSVFGAAVFFGVGIIALGMHSRRRVCALAAGFAAGAGLFVFLISRSVFATLVIALIALLGSGFFAFVAVFSVWLLKAVYELDEARETRARLAVAEERLRFGRDLHDVMGRNLSVIALKSELAVQLARRGRPEAVEQMIEVQRIAGESQREVRDVVRGYREADLEVELAGAQGVLTAAGIECRVTGRAAGLPVEVQSALAWVVREAATNVLRHGNAGRCSVGVRVSEGRVVLTVENDGAAGASHGGGGSGIAGLRERLAAVDGTLDAGRIGEAVFRLVAEVPLTGAGVREVSA
ncbi:sensor histidine kinase [Streptomyces viridochromogenes]|uniref:sensor histidine kinase n=1 Tax=Streptomyces viridochromogenes TaxID=1938 RepID=UPI00069F8D82|nr:histidine kinase [Streptomyces viridochromogenes]KOG08124.1 histidine kinase [Streptomyces viridochromogenes]KOG09804.1 histidine kinase [Streptomyces viridochromogenes]